MLKNKPSATNTPEIPAVVLKNNSPVTTGESPAELTVPVPETFAEKEPAQDKAEKKNDCGVCKKLADTTTVMKEWQLISGFLGGAFIAMSALFGYVAVRLNHMF